MAATPLAAAERPVEGSSDAEVLSAEADIGPAATSWPPGIRGLDVSHWNGYPDFEMLRGRGVRFVFSKATQGTSFVDDTFQRHTREARSAGVLPGAYHFFDYNKGGLAQARHFLDTLRGSTGLGALLPLVVDVETLSSLGTPNKTKARQRLHALMDELYRQTGRYPMIYTSRHMWNRVVGGPTSFGRYPLWVACWSCDEPLLPNGWNDWKFWQVGVYKFPNGRLDGNVYRRSMDALRLDRQSNVRLRGGAAWSPQRDVKADLRGYDGTHVRFAAEGDTFGAWKPFQGLFPVTLGPAQGQQDLRLQLRSFRGVKTVAISDSIKLDSVPPSIAGPRLSLRGGARVPKSGSRVPTHASMSASDQTSGLESTSLLATCGGAKRAAKFSTAGISEMPIRLDRRGCTIRAQAADRVGHKRTTKLDPAVTIRDISKGADKVTFQGTWKTIRNKDALGMSLARTSTAGDQVRVVVEGAQLAIVARRGPAGGRFKVILDGKTVDTVDLYSNEGDSRRMVWVRNVPPGKHILKVRATRDSAPRSSGAIVWLDAVVALDRRK